MTKSSSDPENESGQTASQRANAENEKRVAERVLNGRRARLKPPKLESDPEGGGKVRFKKEGDTDPTLLMHELFPVADSDAAKLLFNGILNLACSDVERGCMDGPNGITALVHELAPRDTTEAMLCSQMAGAHLAAMECLKRAALTNQTFEGRDMGLTHAERLMRIFTQQMEALSRHRGKGEQKMTVEHVHVYQGGQAIVGPVSQGAKEKTEGQPHAKHASHASERPVRRQDKMRPALPQRSDEERPMQDAWGQESGGSAREPERLEARKA